MGSLFDPGQEHAGLALRVDDLHRVLEPGAFACRVCPGDLVFFAAVAALDHGAFSAHLNRLLFVFDVDECDRVRVLADEHQLGSGIEFFNLCLLVNLFEGFVCFECRLRFRAGNHERERRAREEEVFEVFHIFGFRARLRLGQMWLWDDIYSNGQVTNSGSIFPYCPRTAPWGETRLGFDAETVSRVWCGTRDPHGSAL